MIEPIVVDALPNLVERYLLSDDYRIYTTPYSVTCVKSKTDRVYILKSEHESLVRARELFQRLNHRDAEGWTYPRLARDTSSNFQSFKGRVEPNLILPDWHYQRCVPSLLTERWKMIDMRSAYWQVLSKSKSAYCMPDAGGKINYVRMSNREEVFYNRMLDIYSEHKKLRLALIGVNCTGYSKKVAHTYLHKRRLCEMQGTAPSMFQPLALSVVRASYEITQIQARLSDTVYAQADCVALEYDDDPYFWDSIGVAYSVKGEGALDVICPTVWSCGEESTGSYRHIKAMPEVDRPFKKYQTPEVSPIYWQNFYPGNYSEFFI